ncbi:Uncharacterised protein [Mycobacteroides abscessus subsp. abscessus]|nr:Uncharacterised protein [Mycobacteroides abscessus subsp. abscessus]SKU88308.1 Uncharacterised protein [Mycobacteroides abscessus subsp. abscessus]
MDRSTTKKTFTLLFAAATAWDSVSTCRVGSIPGRAAAANTLTITSVNRLQRRTTLR